jgi:hypothetical protein
MEAGRSTKPNIKKTKRTQFFCWKKENKADTDFKTKPIQLRNPWSCVGVLTVGGDLFGG